VDWNSYVQLILYQKLNTSNSIKKVNVKQKIVTDTESSESEKSWNSNMDVSFEEPLAQPLSSDQILTVSSDQPDLNPGDYILIEFESIGKKKLKYKYVATVVSIIKNSS